MITSYSHKPASPRTAPSVPRRPDGLRIDDRVLPAAPNQSVSRETSPARRIARSAEPTQIDAPSAIAIAPISQDEMATELRALARQFRAQLSPSSTRRDVAAVRQFEREALLYAQLQARFDDAQSVLGDPK
ncbi:hypothetical protein CFI11_19580 [Thalassococcus sp. S3]|nr:hypothetical protein CFI11_19580 [Thalassococcus sp. S3]